MGTSNPYAFQQQKDYSLDLGLQGSFAQSLRYFGTNKEALNQKVSQFNAEIPVKDYLSGNSFGYRFSRLTAKTDEREFIQIRWNKNTKISKSYAKSASDFKEAVDGLRADQNQFTKNLGMSGALIVGMLTALFFEPAFPVAVAVLQGLGLVGNGIDIYGTINLAFSYIDHIKKLKQSYNSCPSVSLS